jgi:L-Ala-D/L-Glu epimerase
VSIALEYSPLNLRTAHPFGISYGSSSDTHNVLVKLKYQDFEGLGEAAPASYHNETADTVMAVLQQWSQSQILGSDPFAIVDISQRLDKSIAGNCAAKAAVEMALHDLVGKLLGQPTYKVLGLSSLTAPMTDFTIGIDSLEMVEKKTKEAVDAGYKMLKVKQGTAYDREIIKTVRKIAPDLPLRVDANGGWTPKQAVTMSHFLAENNVQFIEQPLPKFAHVNDFRFVRERSPIPIFADESICRAPDVVKLAHAIDGVVVKLAKTGGLLEALQVIYAARAHGLQIMFGCMIESSIGVTAAVHLASLVDYLDLDGALLLANDPYLGAEYHDGYLKLSDRPGLGVIAR